MKTAESKTTATAQNLQTKGEEQQPFFQQERSNGYLGGGSSAFFSSNHNPQPFFSKPAIQTKLSIGEPGDKYEQEADKMADQVVQRLAENNAQSQEPIAAQRQLGLKIQRKPIFESNAEPNLQAKFSSSATKPINHIQTKCAECEQEEKLQKKEQPGEEEQLQKKPIFESNAEPPEIPIRPRLENVPSLQKQCAECATEEETPKVQRQSDSATTPNANSSLESRLSSSRGGGSPLPENTRTQMEGAFGSDFSGVRVHTDSSAVQMNNELGAQAFTHGSDVYFNAGKYDDGSTEGKRLLGHELTHVVQQGGGLMTQTIMRLPTENDINGGRAAYSSYCGWIDWTHALPGFPTTLINAVRSASNQMQQDNDGEPEEVRLPAMQSGGLGLIFTSVAGRAFLRRPLSDEEVLSVALRLMMLQSTEFEQRQSWTDFIKRSSFSEEDLPSNVIGFYRAARGYQRTAIEGFCGAQNATDSLNEFRGHSFERNRTFRPLGTVAASWPVELSNISPADFPGPLIDNVILTSGTLLGLGGGGERSLLDISSCGPLYQIIGEIEGTGLARASDNIIVMLREGQSWTASNGVQRIQVQAVSEGAYRLFTGVPLRWVWANMLRCYPRQTSASPVPASGGQPASAVQRKPYNDGEISPSYDKASQIGVSNSGGSQMPDSVQDLMKQGRGIQRQSFSHIIQRDVNGNLPQSDEDIRRQLLYSTTTLRRVEPLSQEDTQLLNAAIPGAPIYTKIKERDNKSENRRILRQDLSNISPIAGVQDENSTLGHRIAFLSRKIEQVEAEIARLDQQIQTELRAIGVSSEADLVQMITIRFPLRFVARGKQIAITQLEENREIAERESQRYGNETTHTEDRQGLRRVASDLLTRQQAIERLQERLHIAQSDVEPLPGGVREPSQMSSSAYDVRVLTDQINERSREFNQQRDIYSVQYPVLMRINNYQGIANSSDVQINVLVGGALQPILENIRATQQNIRNDRLKIWNLNDIIDMTVLDLEIGNNDTLMQVVQEHIRSERSEEALIRVALGALALTAGIIATVATGGVALAAAGVGLVAGGFQAYQSIQNFRAESAASNIALDPRIADISRQEPDLFWLVLDIAFVVFDVVQVLRIFNEMRMVAHALRDAGELGEFARMARRTMPRAAADRVIVRASRYAASLPTRAGGLAGVGPDWLGTINPLTSRPFEVANMVEELAEVRRVLLATEDLGRIRTSLHNFGVENIDRAMLSSIKQYLFNSQGIAFTRANYDAWRRLASGAGELRDAQFIIHEAEEINRLRQIRSAGGVDFMGRGIGYSERSRWASEFERAYMEAHRRALEAEYEFLAQQIASYTNGRVRVGRTLAAVADSSGIGRNEVRRIMQVDGIALQEHREFGRWLSEANQIVEIGRGTRESLRLGSNPTLIELVQAIRNSRLRPR